MDQNGRHFAGDIMRWIFVDEFLFLYFDKSKQNKTNKQTKNSTKNSLKFLPIGPINQALV